MIMQTAVTPCSLVELRRNVGGSCCPRHSLDPGQPTATGTIVRLKLRNEAAEQVWEIRRCSLNAA